MTLADGLHPVPPGKIAAVVTSLEMTAPPPRRAERMDAAWRLRRVEHPDPGWYRDLYRRIGEPWLWFSRLKMTDEQLAGIVRDPAVEVHALEVGGRDEGLLELDFRAPRLCELAFFGLTPAMTGQGAGRWLMNRAIEQAWSRPIARFWVHTCTLDHPDAPAFYVRSGFRPFRREVEVADDPRLDGTLPRSAARQIPIV